MKKIILIITGALLGVIAILAIYTFAFEKTIPTNWANEQIEAIKASNISEIFDEHNMPSITAAQSSAKYTKDGDKTVTTYDSKDDYKIKNTSANGNESYEVNWISYDEKGDVKENKLIKYYKEGDKFYKEENGEKTEISDFNDLVFFYGIMFGTLYTNEGVLQPDVINAINDNLEKVTQKGLYVTLYLVKDNVTGKITYSLSQKRICRFEVTTNTYTDNVLTGCENYWVEF